MSDQTGRMKESGNQPGSRLFSIASYGYAAGRIILVTNQINSAVEKATGTIVSNKTLPTIKVPKPMPQAFSKRLMYTSTPYQ
ncbi:MAG: hypothetical protein AB2748_19050 [Candidatus Thiodiazotropha endolucinida]